jgi:formylglycine-generating enzyme required for sulfatase activity
MPFVNSLGMKFVAVPIVGESANEQKVLFSIWETRVRDYAALTPALELEARQAHFEKNDEHPAVCVSWEEATAFCERLSKMEGLKYRLPSDHEWSCAVGVGDKEDANTSPASKNRKVEGYPWGPHLPPPDDAGKYCESTEAPQFPFTSPVGSFAANQFGLFDMGGNVWEWCADLYRPAEPGRPYRVMRGASWNNLGPLSLRSSCRYNAHPADRLDNVGFRVVLVVPSH